MTNIINFEAYQKAQEDNDKKEIEQLIRNPIIHVLDNLIYSIKENGEYLEVYNKSTGSTTVCECPPTTYLALLAASVLEQKIYNLRVKYEGKDSIDLTKPPSDGIPC